MQRQPAARASAQAHVRDGARGRLRVALQRSQPGDHGIVSPSAAPDRSRPTTRLAQQELRRLASWRPRRDHRRGCSRPGPSTAGAVSTASSSSAARSPAARCGAMAARNSDIGGSKIGETLLAMQAQHTPDRPTRAEHRAHLIPQTLRLENFTVAGATGEIYPGWPR